MKIFNFFKTQKKNKLSENDLLQAGACPNCWGLQEYERQFIEYVEDKTKAALSGDHSAQKAFIQQFIQDHLTGIRLKKDGDYQVCPACGSKHKLVSTHTN